MEAFSYFSLRKNKFMESLQCLNCEETVERNYCSTCGQKTATHRITLKHFLFHDIIHGVWHLDKGILFTLKQALIRPGRAALDYISGKRVRYYNVFYLIMLLIGLGIFIEHLYVDFSSQYVTYSKLPVAENDASLDFLGKYVKFFLLLAIPVYAFNSFLLFNKKRLLYSEHLIVFGMLFLGIILITLLGNVLFFAEFNENTYLLADWSNFLVPILLVPYLINGLYGAFGRDYTKISFVIRSLIYIVLIVAELKVLAHIVRFYLSNYS